MRFPLVHFIEACLNLAQRFPDDSVVRETQTPVFETEGREGANSSLKSVLFQGTMLRRVLSLVTLRAMSLTVTSPLRMRPQASHLP